VTPLRKPKPQGFDLVVEKLPLNDDGWRALEQRVRARQPALHPEFLAGFDRYGRPQVKSGPRKGLRVSVTAGSRAEALTEVRKRIGSALTGWKDLRFYDPASALASARITVLPRPKSSTPEAGGGSPGHTAGT